MSPEVLAQVLGPLQSLFDPKDYPDLLVGLGSPDDAAVYRLDGQRALILTTDFFTPIVDDPYDYGAIAAANALSDVYAMGGQPVLALNLVAFPAKLPVEILSEVMRGMAETVRASGAVIAGGHSIQDDEPKVGLCVVGMGCPEQLLTKAGARAGDTLVLTKPLGSGVITTVAKANQAAPEHIAEATRWMKHLNRGAGESAVAAGVRGGTDITGFGLIGHAWEMAEASGVGLRIDLGKVPFLDGAQRYADDGIFPGGTWANCESYKKHTRFIDDMCEGDCMLLFDAQTSGGLLLSIPPNRLPQFRDEMTRRDEAWWEIGQVIGDRDYIEVI
jgi:selenide,water dikinase